MTGAVGVEPPETLYFTHKGCYQKFKATHGHTLWQPLGAFLFYLTNNTSYDAGREEEWAKTLAGVL